jgi:pentatricopeptide repeat protein
MIKAYGEADRIDDSIDVFNSMLRDQRVTPNMFTFNVLLNACAISKSLGHLAYDRATELVSLLSTNERCVQWQLRPDKVTYNTLLKCLTKSSTCKEGASIIAESIFLEMEERHKTDDQIKPNMITFNLAITVCLQVNDQERVNAFMNRMEQYNIKVDARLCNAILNHYAQTGTFESAERAESFLSNLKILGQADKSVGPNVFTYNILLNAWGRSNHPNFAHRMISIYESMLSDRVTPDAITYNTLVFHLSKMPNNIGLADKLLQELENSSNENVAKHQPGYDIYATLIKAYIKFLDAENATRLLFRWFGVVRGKPTVSKERDLVVESMTPLYHKLIQLWIQLGDLERATTVTEKIYDLYVDGNRERTTFVRNEKHHGNSIPEPPYLETYQLLYEAWNKSCHQSKEMYLTKIKARIESYQQ